MDEHNLNDEQDEYAEAAPRRKPPKDWEWEHLWHTVYGILLAALLVSLCLYWGWHLAGRGLS